MTTPADMYRIITLNGPDKGRRSVIHADQALVGTDSDCRLVVADEQVEPRHAMLERRDDGVYIRLAVDQARLAVNQAVVTTTKLEHNDEFELGSTRFQYQVMEETPFYATRSSSFIELLGRLGVGLVLLVELAVIGLMVLWNPNHIDGVAEALPDAGDAIETADDPAPLDQNALEEELSGAKQRLAELDEASAQQSPEEVWARREADRIASERQNLHGAIAELENQVASLEAIEPVPIVVVAPEVGPDSASLPSPAPTEPVLDDPVVDAEPPVTKPTSQALAREQLRLAREQIAQKQLDEAEQTLLRIKKIVPGHVPTLITYARLLERRQDYQGAVQQWDDVLRNVVDASVFEEAAAERARAARLAVLKQNRSVATVEEPAPPKVLPKRIQVGELNRKRLQRREGFDEVRLATIQLSPALSEGRIYTDKVRVDVQFFDRNQTTAEIQSSRVPISNESLNVDGTWAANEDRTLSVLYMVPQGFRQQEHAEHGESLQYYGYVARVYYDGVLQDEKAMPTSLLRRAGDNDIKPGS